MPTITELHDSLRRTVKRIMEVSGNEHAEWRLMALRQAYEDYGIKVDNLLSLSSQPQKGE